MIGKLGKYYRQRNDHGVNPLQATLTLPGEVRQFVQRRRTPGSQIEGFERYDLPLLASYSRSGTNWTRYIIETISGRPTPGQVRIYYGPNYIVDRAHQAYPVMHHHDRVILSLRDYRECLIRHNTKLWSEVGDVTAFLEDTTVFQRPEWYIKNLQAFDEFEGDKLLMHYEDLQQNPQDTILRLADFIGLDRTRSEDFIANLETHYAKSVKSYKSGGHDSSSTSTRDVGFHSKQHLSDAQRREFDQYYASNYPLLWDRYLRRYEVTDA